MKETLSLETQIKLGEAETQLQSQLTSLKQVETELLRLEKRKKDYEDTRIGLHKAIEETKQRVELLSTNKE